MDDMYILFIILGIAFVVFLVVLIFAWCRKTKDPLSIEEELHEIKTLELMKTKTANGNTAKPVHRSLDETGRVPSAVSRSLEDTGRVPSIVVEFIDVQKEPAVDEKNSDVVDKADVNDENAVNDVNVDNDDSSRTLKSSEADNNNERPVRISIGETCINKGLDAPATLTGRTSDA